MNSSPPSYPGTRPVKAPFYGIITRRDIKQDFTSQWYLHTHWTVETIERTMRALSGFTGQGDYLATDDYYRTARFDIATSFVRAWDKTQPTPITNVNQITNLAGQRLVVLLDQHISIATAFAGAQLAKAGLIPNASIPPLLVKLGLIPNEEASATYDPVGDVVENGKQIVGLLANVHKHLTNFFAFNKSNVPRDISVYNDKNVADFAKWLSQDAYFVDQKAKTDMMLQAVGLPSQNYALDAWNLHLASVVQLVVSEVAFEQQAKNGGGSAITPFALVGSDTELMIHGTHMANLFLMAVNIRPSSTVTRAFPEYKRIPESFHNA